MNRIYTMIIQKETYFILVIKYQFVSIKYQFGISQTFLLLAISETKVFKINYKIWNWYKIIRNNKHIDL